MVKETLLCTRCGERYEEDGAKYQCDKCDSFLQIMYEQAHIPFEINSFWDYPYIPKGKVYTPIKPFIYQGKLGEYLGLKELYIAFSGYWPEKGAYIETGTFKDFEMYPAMARFLKAYATGKYKGFVIPSSGNAARAAINAALKFEIPIRVVVPPKSLYKLWIVKEDEETEKRINSLVRIITFKGNCDYNHAIQYTKKIVEEGWWFDGGFRNPARRDGVGTIAFEFIRQHKKIDYYIQPVGSATGPIGIYEALKRFGEETNFILSQNEAYHPLYDLIKGGKVKPGKGSILSEELTNENPPYERVREIMTTKSRIVLPTNKEVLEAKSLFEEIEGIDIEIPSAFGVASLIKVLEEGIIKDTDVILLHITGGGIKKIYEEKEIIKLEQKKRSN